jgi:hypothetical protein
MSVRSIGDVSTLRGLAQRMRKVAGEKATAEIARRVAPEFTRMAGSAYDSGRTVYGAPRPRSTVDGRPLTLVDTGASRASVRYRASGSSIRVAQGPRWRKFLIEKYAILPQGARAPIEWLEAYRKHALDVVVETMRGKRR